MRVRALVVATVLAVLSVPLVAPAMAFADTPLPTPTVVPKDFVGGVVEGGGLEAGLKALCTPAIIDTALCAIQAGAAGYSIGQILAQKIWGNNCLGNALCAGIGDIGSHLGAFLRIPGNLPQPGTALGWLADPTGDQRPPATPAGSGTCAVATGAVTNGRYAISAVCTGAPAGTTSITCPVGFAIALHGTQFTGSLPQQPNCGSWQVGSGAGQQLMARKGDDSGTNGTCGGDCTFLGYLSQAGNTTALDVGGVAWTNTYVEKCRNGSATATATASVTYTPTVASPVAPSPSLASCDSILPGSHLEDLTVSGGRNGTAEVTTDFPSYSNTATTAYPLCTTSVNTSSPCFLDLRRNGVSCFGGPVVCAAWPTYQSEMTCDWGPYHVPLSTCLDDYSATFDGETVTKPSPAPTATPGAGGLPSTGTDTNGDGDGSATGALGPAPSENCMGSAWSWNPINWVLVPVKCALMWAAVPQAADLSTDFNTIKTALAGSTIGPWFTAFGGLLSSLPASASGCLGPEVDFGMTTPPTVIHPFAACSGPMHTVAGFSYALTTVVIVFMGGAAGIRAILGAFGFNFDMGKRGAYQGSGTWIYDAGDAGVTLPMRDGEIFAG